MTGVDLAFIIPLWKRTRNVERVYGAVRATTPDARVLFVASSDDRDVLGELGRLSLLTDRNALIVDWPGGSRGDYARKINAGYQATDEPFLFTGADDVVPHPGWYQAARSVMRCPHGDETCPCQDGTPESCHYQGVDPMRCPRTGDAPCRSCSRVSVVGTVDGCNPRTMKGLHSTHSLVARWYADCCAVIDAPGAIYCEAYSHEWCDDELVRTAMSRGAYAHAFDSIVEHLHMTRDATLDDDTYRRGREQSKTNRRIFMRRRHLWGDGTPPPRGNYRSPRPPRVARRL